jgi:hypothetical protein
MARRTPRGTLISGETIEAGPPCALARRYPVAVNNLELDLYLYAVCYSFYIKFLGRKLPLRHRHPEDFALNCLFAPLFSAQLAKPFLARFEPSLESRIILLHMEQ